MGVRIWKLRTQILSLDKPMLMGIVNVTPDSFSDGGRFFKVRPAVQHALKLAEAGAGILDLGGESTRPGSDGVSADEELRRLLPVLMAIRDALPKMPISIDTVKADVAEECLRAGAEIINDVSSCADPEMLRVLRESGAGYCLMHSIGTPKTMQDDPRYENVVEEVFDFLREHRNRLLEEGIDAERIVVDPGLGFGKTTGHNWALVENMERFHELDTPLLVGHSRKRFIAETYDDRDEGTRIVTQMLIDKGVQIIRLHDMLPASRTPG